jgi:hypothetical protein
MRIMMIGFSTARGFLLVFVSGMLFCGPLHAEEPSDPLSQRVTVRLPRVYLGELLEHLTESSGVALAVAPRRGPVDGVQLTAIVHQRPLREVLDGLAELLTTRSNRCEWRRDGQGGYTLHLQRPLEQAAAVNRARMMEQWAQDLRTMHRVAGLPQAQQAASARAHPDLFPEGVLESGKPGLLSLVPPEGLEALLRGVELPFDPTATSPHHQQALRLGLQLPPGSEPPIGTMRSSFYVTYERDGVAPVLWVRNASGTAANVLGGWLWDGHFLRKEAPGWKTVMDPEVQDFRLQRVLHDPGLVAQEQANNYAEWLVALAMKQGLNFLGDMVDPLHTPGGSAAIGREQRASLLALVESGGLMTRRQGEIHLVRHATALTHPRNHLLPWPLVREIREEAEAQEGYLPLARLAWCFGLSGAQRSGLAEEFPDLAVEGGPEQWAQIFRFYSALPEDQQRELVGEQGLAIHTASPLALAVLFDGPPVPAPWRELLQRGTVETRVRLTATNVRAGSSEGTSSEDGKPEAAALPPVQLQWEVLRPEQMPLRQPITINGRRPLRPEWPEDLAPAAG